MYLLGFVLYTALCAGIAWFLAKVLTRRAREPWVRWVVAGVLAPIVFLLPLADEFVGYFQFERLCDEAKEANIYGTIPVGEDLYTPDGKWRLGLQEGDHDQRWKEGVRVKKALEGYLRSNGNSSRPQEIRAAIPIDLYEVKIYAANGGQLLADWRHYSTRGGWLSRSIGGSGDNIIVRQQCMPEIVWSGLYYQEILKFTRQSEVRQ